MTRQVKTARPETKRAEAIIPPRPFAKPRNLQANDGQPFEDAEALWFWFIAARQAQAEGATTGPTEAVPRPCEPVDVLNIINRLYRNRILKMNHFQVLKYYGERFMRPDASRPRECPALRLWDEAMVRLTDSFYRAGLLMTCASDIHSFSTAERGRHVSTNK